MLSVLGAFLCKRKWVFVSECLIPLLVVIIIVIKAEQDGRRRHHHHVVAQLTTRLCVQLDRNTLRAQHKTCFLRPDTGPCRADIIQYYFDAMLGACYRFFWGGCQGNGNRFEDRVSCMNYCYMNSSAIKEHTPYYCNLAFDFGTCFGHYNRWTWDKFQKTCKRRLYSGCGGNQNNFETRAECLSTCLTPPNNTLARLSKYTTCIPFTIDAIH